VKQRLVLAIGLLTLAAGLFANAAAAQDATTGRVIGTVTDPTGAVVPGASVILNNTGTGVQVAQQTNTVGQYTFVSVMPGDYQITVKKSGFLTSDVASIRVDVAKSYNVDVKLQLGATSQTVTVEAGARVELQTTDSQVGTAVGGEILGRLPTLQRDASEFLTLQPATTPYDTSANGGFGNQGGTVAGARSDQNTVSMDGIDITDNTVGGGANATNFIPTGVESVEEFRVGVTNSNATFGRASGGQIAIISKSGGNSFHGDGYWQHQSDGYNANSWDLNRIGVKKTPFKDNREGVSIGGPVLKNRTFFFSNYEVRRFPAGQTVTHIVPTDSLRNGILQFTDASGVLRQYDLASSTQCGPNGNLACDPRGLGISPTVQALYNLNPTGNDPTVAGADVNNTDGLRTSVTTPIKQDFVTFRLDHNFTDKLHFFGRYIYSRNVQVTPLQIEALAGQPALATTGSQVRGDGVIGALDYVFNSTTTNTVRYGWIRNRSFFPAISPSGSAALLALPGTDSAAGPVALAPGLGTVGLLDVPIDVDTQRARTQGNFQRNKQLVDEFSKLAGTHTLVAGGSVRWMPIIAQRNDKVVGSLASLVALMDADGNGGAATIPAADRPPSCSATVTTFCLQSADVVKWDRLYAATLGIVDNVNVLAVRDGNLDPQPFGTPLISNANMQAYDFYGQDTWRISPRFTLTYGLDYGWQTPPHEAHNEQTFIVDASNNQILTAQGYIDAKLAAAQSGQAFNPTIGYLPIAKSGRSTIYNPDYGDFAPRASLAWSPSYSDGMLGRMFGVGKTVVRGGFGIYYDRINNVQSVEIPQLGVGFAQTLVLSQSDTTNPLRCSANGVAAGCNAGAGLNDIGASGFRVGVDGTIPVPSFPTVSSPIVPSTPFGEVLSFSLDPSFKVGRSYSLDLTVQRELPGNMLMEVGYIGRLGRDLPNSVDFDSSPYMLKDAASGQTFAQAFDAVASEVASNQPITPQQWFENQLPGFNALPTASGGCGGAFGSTTECLVSQNQAQFKSRFVSSLFQNMGFDRSALGLLPYNNLQVVLALFVRTHNDLSNYNAATFTLHKRPSHGLQFDLNYTFSRSLDQLGGVQNNAGTYATSFNPNLQYGPSLFDRTHVFNALFNYDLPGGTGHKFSFNNGFLDRVIGGWYVSGVFRANSGLPLPVVGGDFGGGPFANSVNMIPTVNPSSVGEGAHHGVTGTTFGSGGSTNIFADPDAVAADFRYPNISTDGRDGSGHPLRGLGLWNLDARLGKTTTFRERYKVEISADFFNLFNHVNFFDPSLNINNPSSFGVISSELIPADRQQGSRWIELGLRVSF